jgi:hypothetical protein
MEPVEAKVTYDILQNAQFEVVPGYVRILLHGVSISVPHLEEVDPTRKPRLLLEVPCPPSPIINPPSS